MWIFSGFLVRTTRFGYFPTIYYVQRDLWTNKQNYDTLPLILNPIVLVFLGSSYHPLVVFVFVICLCHCHCHHHIHVILVFFFIVSSSSLFVKKDWVFCAHTNLLQHCWSQERQGGTQGTGRSKTSFKVNFKKMLKRKRKYFQFDLVEKKLNTWTWSEALLLTENVLRLSFVRRRCHLTLEMDTHQSFIERKFTTFILLRQKLYVELDGWIINAIFCQKLSNSLKHVGGQYLKRPPPIHATALW